jgi:hypothetical protein
VGKISFLDGLIANYDRHGSNWLTARGRIVAIDHGLTFAKSEEVSGFFYTNDCRFALPDTSPFRWRGKPQPIPLRSSYKDKLIKLIGDGLPAEDGGTSWLGSFGRWELKREERVSLIKRAKLLVADWDTYFVEP